jgi:hypothetical protein
MHTYSTDNDLRPKVYGVLALLAYGITILVELVTTTLSTVLPFAVGFVVSWGLAFTVVWKIHDRWFWKTRIARALGFTRVPNLNGKWEGWIVTSYEGDIDDQALHPDNAPSEDGQKMKAWLDIDQTWRKINVHFETTQTPSDSNGATMLTEKGKWPSLSYQYENPGSPLVEGLDMHFGTASLEYRDEGDRETLEGLYYTGPGRDNNGLMYFEQVD